MNTSKKGWKKEKACRELLESQGWTTVFKSIRWKWGTLDFAGLFDSVLAKESGGENAGDPPEPQRLFISNKHFQGYHLAHQKEITAYKGKFGLLGERYELWIWHKPKWTGRGANKVWNKAKWQVIVL